MNALIIANGPIKNRNFYKKLIGKSDVIIAADGGADNCIKLGILPDHVIGDLDSISSKAKEKFKKIIIHDDNQDTTDLEKSISLAKKLKCRSLVIIGATGSRIDHTLSNIIILSRSKIQSRIIDEANEIYVVDRKIELKGKKGAIVSVIPVSNVKGLVYHGLKWSVKDKNISLGWIGISNVMTGKKAIIKLRSGKIIVIKATA